LIQHSFTSVYRSLLAQKIWCRKPRVFLVISQWSLVKTRILPMTSD
jgi:hypothetical protein